MERAVGVLREEPDCARPQGQQRELVLAGTVSMTTSWAGTALMILRAAWTPSMPGMTASMTMTSGRWCTPSSTASRPSLASAMTIIPACSSAPLIRRRANGSSSATMTRSAPSDGIWRDTSMAAPPGVRQPSKGPVGRTAWGVSSLDPLTDSARGRELWSFQHVGAEHHPQRASRGTRSPQDAASRLRLPLRRDRSAPPTRYNPFCCAQPRRRSRSPIIAA
jgi:hypothetical protein